MFYIFPFFYFFLSFIAQPTIQSMAYPVGLTRRADSATTRGPQAKAPFFFILFLSEEAQFLFVWGSAKQKKGYYRNGHFLDYKLKIRQFYYGLIEKDIFER